jgi:hypothetical protein
VIFLFGTKSFHFITKISVFFIFRTLYFGCDYTHTHIISHIYFSALFLFVSHLVKQKTKLKQSRAPIGQRLQGARPPEAIKSTISIPQASSPPSHHKQLQPCQCQSSSMKGRTVNHCPERINPAATALPAFVILQ